MLVLVVLLPELHSPDCTSLDSLWWADFFILMLDINFLSRVCSKNCWDTAGMVPISSAASSLTWTARSLMALQIFPKASSTSRMSRLPLEEEPPLVTWIQLDLITYTTFTKVKVVKFSYFNSFVRVGLCQDVNEP